MKKKPDGQVLASTQFRVMMAIITFITLSVIVTGIWAQDPKTWSVVIFRIFYS